MLIPALLATTIPVGWTVDDADLRCIASRTGPDKSDLLGVTATPLTDRLIIRVAIRTLPLVRYNEPVVILGPSSERVDAQAFTGVEAATPQVVGFEVPRGLLASAQGVFQVTIGQRPILQLSAGELRAIVPALAACERKVVRDAGIEEAAIAAVATFPRMIGRSEPLFGQKDYPREARRAGAQGRVLVRFVVQPSGVPSRCEVVISSGRTDLDTRTCEIVVARSRYVPARALNGQSIASPQLTSIRWALP